MEESSNCTMLIHHDNLEPPQIQNLKKGLESEDVRAKIAAMKEIIVLLVNGEKLPQVMVTIIRFVMPSRDHTLQKLSLLYWEVVEKTDENGELLAEMILVCNALMNNLEYPNEYVRGSTLRFLCKLKEREILVSLIPTILQTLDDRYAYVKRNAVLAIFSICKTFPDLIPQAPELIENFLISESDPSCQRNAFLMLFNCDRNRSILLLNDMLEKINTCGEMLQLVVIQMIRKVVKYQPYERGNYLRCIFMLLQSRSASVQYEAAHTLLTLSSAPTAVKAAANTYINLLVKESDQNVKMVVLDRIVEIKEKFPKILEKLVMDLLRVLANPNMEIRQKSLDIALNLINPRNVFEVIHLLKKEMSKTQAETFENRNEYRQMIVKSIHSCAVKFPEVASDVVHLLLDFLSNDNESSALDVILFVREVVETYPDLRKGILHKLFEKLDSIPGGNTYRAALWIIGEYSDDVNDIEQGFSSIQKVLGGLPLHDVEELENEEIPADKPVSSRPTTNADGTYVSASALLSTPRSFGKVSQHPLRDLIKEGDFFLATVLSSCLTKLALKYNSLDEVESKKNRFQAQVLLYLVSLLKLGEVTGSLESDSREKINLCFEILSNGNVATKDIYTVLCKQSFSDMLHEQRERKAHEGENEENVVSQPDDIIKFRQLRAKKYSEYDIEEDDFDSSSSNLFNIQRTSDLSKIYQLTGFSDPIYSEAEVVVHQFDITLNFTIINQTPDTLHNLALELATLGDLKLVERPQTYSLGPYSTLHIKTSFKVSSTETGQIFGCIVYDIAGTTITEYTVILSDIPLDIIDYISPADTDTDTFRSMWSSFGWENIISINTEQTDINAFVDHIVDVTNIKCVGDSIDYSCGFLTANFYAKSVFGEDALVNLSIEQNELTGKLEGFVKIRSEKKGMCASLGEKIIRAQKA
eukprot:TRINITY_DN6761_c0_g1_i1.p1 TRINITY_DN6761_c0_g1~~TRINITY_DN6761_c0_g1_i1.p1  ORF type:complete len:925 (+),score=213.13 TRINITY_DN6761_c0_g1_i1:57-2831(+)